RGAARQRAHRGGLDGRTLADRVGVRHAELDHVGARLGEQRHQTLGGVQVGVAGRDEDDECGAPLGARAGKGAVDAVHDARDPKTWRASATSLSPRPDTLTMTSAPRGRLGARLRSSAMAWADSKAGTMPSARDRYTNASSASTSVTGTYSARPESR